MSKPGNDTLKDEAARKMAELLLTVLRVIGGGGNPQHLAGDFYSLTAVVDAIRERDGQVEFQDLVNEAKEIIDLNAGILADEPRDMSEEDRLAMAAFAYVCRATYDTPGARALQTRDVLPKYLDRLENMLLNRATGFAAARRVMAAREAKRAETPHYVYFIGAEDTLQTRAGQVKIGLSVDPRSRLSALQTSHPHPLCVLAVIHCDGFDQATTLERELHARFAEHRLSGEWFECCEDILTEIEARLD